MGNKNIYSHSSIKYCHPFLEFSGKTRSIDSIDDKEGSWLVCALEIDFNFKNKTKLMDTVYASMSFMVAVLMFGQELRTWCMHGLLSWRWIMCDLQSRLVYSTGLYTLTWQQQVASNRQKQFYDNWCQWKPMRRGGLGVAIQPAMAQMMLFQDLEELKVVLCRGKQAQRWCTGSRQPTYSICRSHSGILV